MSTFDVFYYATLDPTWTPRGGVPTYIGELDPNHRAKLYSFLCRRAEILEFKFTLEELLRFPGPGGDMAQLAYDAALDERAEQPLAWLLETDFMRALGALLLGDGNQQLVRDWELESQ